MKVVTRSVLFLSGYLSDGRRAGGALLDAALSGRLQSSNNDGEGGVVLFHHVLPCEPLLIFLPAAIFHRWDEPGILFIALSNFWLWHLASHGLVWLLLSLD